MYWKYVQQILVTHFAIVYGTERGNIFDQKDLMAPFNLEKRCLADSQA